MVVVAVAGEPVKVKGYMAELKLGITNMSLTKIDGGRGGQMVVWVVRLRRLRRRRVKDRGSGL